MGKILRLNDTWIDCVNDCIGYEASPFNPNGYLIKFIPYSIEIVERIMQPVHCNTVLIVETFSYGHEVSRSFPRSSALDRTTPFFFDPKKHFIEVGMTSPINYYGEQ